MDALVAELRDAKTAEIWPIGPADVDWFVDLGLRRYPKNWCPIGTETWLRQRVLLNPASHLAIRSANAAVVVGINYQPWTPWKFEAVVNTTMCEEGCVWEVIPLLRLADKWAQRKRCKSLRLASETKYELGALARRIGMKQGEPYYILEYDNG